MHALRYITAAVLLFFLFLPAAASAEAADIVENSREHIFITAEISNDKPYTGQAAEVTYTLYFNGTAPKILDTAYPVHEGIWTVDHSRPRYMPSRTESFDGAVYRSTVIKQMTVVPLHEGRLTISGYRIRCIIPKNLSPHAGMAPEDSLDIAAPEITFDALPLPEPVPEGFSGAVGRFSTTVNASADTVHAGSTLELTAVFKGRGNLRTLLDRPFSFPDGLEPVTTGTGTAFDSLKPVLTSTTTLLAKNPGTYAFTPVSLIVFDPLEARYTSVSSNILKLTVLAEKETPAADDTGTQHSTAPEEGQGTSGDRSFMLPLALFLLLIAAGSYILLKNKPGTARQTAGTLQELREEIESAVDACCNGETGAVEKRNPSAMLRKKGIDEDTVRKTAGLIETLDRLEFSPDKPDREEFEKLGKECRQLSVRLRSRSSRWGRFFSPRP